MLTKQQIELVKATVPVLREHGVALTSHLYKRMLSHNPELMQVFNMAHQRAGFQQQALAGAVLAYAENIENLPALLGAVAHIANKHVSVGIRAEHYPIVGKHLIASIKEVLGDAATPELIDAWTAAYMQLADVLIGAEKAIYDKNAVAEGGWTGWRFFKVAEKSKQTDNVTSFKLVPVDNGKMPEVKAGQYISVRVFVKGQDLMRRRHFVYPGVIQTPGDGQQHWTDKQTDHAEGDQSANDAGKDEDHRQVGAHTDKHRTNDVVHGANTLNRQILL